MQKHSYTHLFTANPAIAAMPSLRPTLVADARRTGESTALVWRCVR
jgi:hypothetical protein